MRIVHFSDFHMNFDQISRCEDLVKRILVPLKQIHQKKAIDVIVFSGDLIDRAGYSFPTPKMQNGFEKFRDMVIYSITDTLGLARNRFIFTLGNHDVDQKVDTKRANTALAKKLNNDAEVDRFVNQNEVEKKVPRIYEYNKFRDGYWLNNKGDAELDITPFQLGVKFKIGDKKVGFNCLNTAWRCYDSKKDVGSILTGKSQITRERTFFEDCQMTFAIGHHMPSMMKDFESNTLEKVIAANYDAYFCGHTHSEDGKMIIRPQGSCFYFIAPGTLTWNISESSNYGNGFMVIDYEQEEHYVEAQKYLQNENEEFIRDNSYGENGVWHQQLPGSSVMRKMENSLFRQNKEVQFYSNDKIKQCIEDLRNPKYDIIHFVALSGIGKTRIVREAFDDGISHPNYYYCEFSDATDVVLYEIDQLIVDYRGKDGLIVLDNCPNSLFLEVVKRKNSYDSNIKIIGVNNEFYDRKGVKSAASIQIELNQDDVREIVNEYVDLNIPVINGDTAIRDQIKRIADGFPGMANLLVKEFKASKDISVHMVDHLVARLLKFDPDMKGDDKIAMQSLALFQPCPYLEPHRKAFEFIRNNENITPLFRRTPQEKRYIFNRTINRHDNSLIEKSACWLNVRPFPLAVWLVGKWFEEDNDEERIAEIVEDIQNQDHYTYQILKDSLYKRLEYMRDSADAQDLMRRLTDGPIAPFCNEKVVCSDLGSRLFLAMSSVNPVAIAHCLNTLLLSKPINWVKEKIDGDIRRNLVWALEKLCFDRDSYEDASKVMALMAVAENESWANNASGQFKQLFHIYLPGTEASLKERVKTLEYLKAAGSDYQDLLLDSIDRAFDNHHFTRGGSGSQFGLERKNDYYPTSNKEIIDYWLDCCKILQQILDQDLTTLNRVSKLIEDHIVQWSIDGMLPRLFSMINHVSECKNNEWGELYKEMSRNKIQRLSFYPSDFLSQYEEFKKIIKPNTFCQKLKDVRVQIYNDYDSSCEKQMEKERELFRPLAKEFVGEKIYKKYEEVKLIAEDKDYNDIWFSPALREIMNEEQTKIMMDHFLTLIKNYGGDAYRSSFVYRFCYVFKDTGAFRTFLNKLLELRYGDLFMRLISHCENYELDSYSFMRLQIDNGKLDPTVPVSYLNYVSISFQDQLCSLIKTFKKDYPDLSDDLMDFVVRHQFDQTMFKEDETLSIIKELVLSYQIKKNKEVRNLYEYSRFVAYLLEKYHDNKFAAKVNRKLMMVMKSEYLRTNIEGIYPVLVKQYTNAIWRDFTRAFSDKKYILFLFQIKDEIGSGSGFGEGPLFQIDNKRIEKLCQKYPNTAPHGIAEMCPIFRYDSEKNKTEGYTFHKWVYWLLDNYGNQKEVLNGLHANMNSYSWTGSIIPLLVQKRECFERIKNHSRPEVREWVDRCIKEVEQDYIGEKNREEYIRLHYN